MNDFLNFEQYISTDFNENSKVWIYQCNRLLSLTEVLSIEPLLNNFVENWKSHGAPVKGFANILFGQFMVFMADESMNAVGGCSTDTSVRLVKQIEQEFAVDFFNRQNLGFIIKDKIQVIPLQQFNYAFENGFITRETYFFNNVVTSKKELLKNWIIPVEKSWLSTKYKLTQQTFTSLN